MENVRRVHQSESDAPRKCPLEVCRYKTDGSDGQCSGVREIYSDINRGAEEYFYNLRKEQGCLNVEAMDRALEVINGNTSS
jgi:hypothetical protein